MEMHEIIDRLERIEALLKIVQRSHAANLALALATETIDKLRAEL